MQFLTAFWPVGSLFSTSSRVVLWLLANTLQHTCPAPSRPKFEGVYCQALFKSRHNAGYNPNVPWKWKRRDWEICVQGVMKVRDKYVFYNPWSQSMKDMLLITFSPCSRLLTEMASASNSSCHCSWIQNYLSNWWKLGVVMAQYIPRSESLNTPDLR